MKSTRSATIGLCLLLSFVTACKNKNMKTGPKPILDAPKGTYAYDLAFLKQHTNDALELISEDNNARVLISPAWQGRVMTSSARGDSGTSFGWLNYQLLAADEKKKQFNPVGGEERFWIGPEGGQYSFYFKKGDSFNIGSWQVPAIIDTIAYRVTTATKSSASFSANALLTNYSGHEFNININRKISLLDKRQLSQEIGIDITPDIHCVSYETINTVTNAGESDWKRENGLMSIWLLGMFTPTPQTVVIIPFHPGPEARSLITDNYFGEMPPERLYVKDSVLYFTCDGRYRSKIGLSPLIAKPIAASYDFANDVLTLILPQVHKNGSYVNSKWELQREPYKGDVINSYNDGPLEDGTQMGPFYEIESSSPALELKKGQEGSYRQVTCHLQSSYPVLKQLVHRLLNVDLDELKR
jgi:hypothetical protein